MRVTGTQNADWQLGRVPRSLGIGGLGAILRSSVRRLLTLPLSAAVRREHHAPLPRASAAEEQIMCGLLERCGELPDGEAGLAEFAEGLVAGEHEEEVDRVVASVAREVAVVAVDHCQAGTHVAREVEG